MDGKGRGSDCRNNAPWSTLRGAGVSAHVVVVPVPGARGHCARACLPASSPSRFRLPKASLESVFLRLLRIHFGNACSLSLNLLKEAHASNSSLTASVFFGLSSVLDSLSESVRRTVRKTVLDVTRQVAQNIMLSCSGGELVRWRRCCKGVASRVTWRVAPRAVRHGSGCAC